MTLKLKMTASLFEIVRADLDRPHAFAAERVGFLKIRAGRTRDGLVLLPFAYVPVADSGYLEDPTVGAMIDEATLRNALQLAYTEYVGIVHVHMHDHIGVPEFSRIDRREMERFMPPFTHVRPEMPHAALVFSRDSFVGRCWVERQQPSTAVDEFTVVGAGVRRIVR